MSKITKAEALYFPAYYIDKHGGVGSACGKCRDFIQISSQCVIVNDPNVSEEHGTCALYVQGDPHPYGKPLKLIPKGIAGYIEGPGVPTYCGICKEYENIGARVSPCHDVEDYPGDVVEYGGCCSLYKPRKVK